MAPEVDRGGRRLDPSLMDFDYLMLRALKDRIVGFIEANGEGRWGDVLDAGCGDSPYYPLFEGHCHRFVRLDPFHGCHPNVLGSLEGLPFVSESFDLVLCFQVLEHAPDPGKTLAECYRVLRRGGTLLLSTHGVWNYHGSPEYGDYYRWTRQGLELLLSCHFAEHRVEAAGGAIRCLFQLLNLYAQGLPLGPLRRLIFLANNVLGASPLAGLTANESFAIGYLAIARK